MDSKIYFIGVIGILSILFVLSMNFISPINLNQDFLDSIGEDFDKQERIINFENKLRYECETTLIYWYDDEGYNEEILYGFDE